MGEILYRQLSDEIIGACIEVHKTMGPHFTENIYEGCLQKELEKRGIGSERQKYIEIFFKGEKLDDHYRVDMLVAGRVIVELKTVPEFTKGHIRKVLSYLEATNYEVVYLVNFANSRLEFKRFVTTNDRKKYKPIINSELK